MPGTATSTTLPVDRVCVLDEVALTGLTLIEKVSMTQTVSIRTLGLCIAMAGGAYTHKLDAAKHSRFGLFRSHFAHTARSARIQNLDKDKPVSYTHLTLPTKA